MKKRRAITNKTVRLRVLWVLCDALCICLSGVVAFALSAEPDFSVLFPTIGLFVVADILLFAGFGMYRNIWRFAGMRELMQVIVGVVSATAANLLLWWAAGRVYPLRATINMLPLMLVMIGGIRMFPRMILSITQRSAPQVDRQRAMIVGAGTAASMTIEQLQARLELGVEPFLAIDDDPDKMGRLVHGIPVMGGTPDIPRLARRHGIEVIIFAIPSASRSVRRRILSICANTSCQVKVLPTLEVMTQGVHIERMRDMDYSDLLSRPEVVLDLDSIRNYLRGRVVMVTGGGGSIGSELCRQMALFNPGKIIILDIYENNAYELSVELKHRYGDKLDVDVVIGSIRDQGRMREVYEQYRPQVIFHTAAHKHVPLMEASPTEAVKNNVFGTWNMAQLADEYGAERFILISSDKAVNPPNVYGATKYLSELVVQYMGGITRQTRYSTVRFGNVLGSAGSVLHLFKQQIAAGGPVTITHKDMTRYFMTISEAARLVLQAGSMAGEGQIFILDMGEPVSIDDFARQFVRLSGYEPDVDMKIEYTGVRPGEKMHEELMQDYEQTEDSPYPGILLGKMLPVSAGDILYKLDRLRLTLDKEPESIKDVLVEIVPTYNNGQSE